MFESISKMKRCWQMAFFSKYSYMYFWQPFFFFHDFKQFLKEFMNRKTIIDTAKLNVYTSFMAVRKYFC